MGVPVAGSATTGGKVETIGTFDSQGSSLKLLFDATTRGTRRMRHATESVYDVASMLDAQTPTLVKGRLPTDIPFFGTFFQAEPVVANCNIHAKTLRIFLLKMQKEWRITLEKRRVCIEKWPSILQFEANAPMVPGMPPPPPCAAAATCPLVCPRCGDEYHTMFERISGMFSATGPSGVQPTDWTLRNKANASTNIQTLGTPFRFGYIDVIHRQSPPQLAVQGLL